MIAKSWLDSLVAQGMRMCKTFIIEGGVVYPAGERSGSLFEEMLGYLKPWRGSPPRKP